MKGFIKIIMIVGLSFVFSVPPAVAQDPSHKKSAEELMRVMRLEETTIAGAATMVNLMIQSNTTLAPYRDVVMKWAKKIMTWEALAPDFIELYTDTYTYL